MKNPIQTRRCGELAVRIASTSTVLAADAAASAQAALRAALAQNGRACALLATGNSQLEFLELLTAAHGIDWSRVTLFHLDEYLGIDAAHSASFRRYLREHVELKVKPRAFHYIEGDALEPLAECRRYAAILSKVEFDLACIGIGENGHLAFNDPPVANFTDPDRIKIVRLDAACRAQQAGEGHFPTLADVPRYAFTLTIPALLNAVTVLCIVPELRKARAVRDALEGPLSTACPASILRTQKQAALFLDESSASLLSHLS